jgi:hypothetical protein
MYLEVGKALEDEHVHFLGVADKGGVEQRLARRFGLSRERQRDVHIFSSKGTWL